MREQALQAARLGVRFTRTMSVQLCPKLQGDLKMLTAGALARRAEIKSDELLLGLANGWWTAMRANKTSGASPSNGA
jgi:hypothetical protein